jgi:hypothetical protein
MLQAPVRLLLVSLQAIQLYMDRLTTAQALP